MSSAIVDSTANEIDEELLSYQPNGIDLFDLDGQVFDTDIEVTNKKTEAYSPENENLVVEDQFKNSYSENNEEEEAFHGFQSHEIHQFLQSRTLSIKKQITMIKNAQGLVKEDYEFLFHGFSIEELNKKLEEILKFHQKRMHLLRKQIKDEECEVKKLDFKLAQHSFLEEPSSNSDDEDVFHGYQTQEINESLHKRYNLINNQIDIMEDDKDKIEYHGFSIEELKVKREFLLAQHMKMKIAKEFDSRPYDITGYVKYLMESSILEQVIKEVLKKDLMKKIDNLVDKCFDDWWNKNVKE